MQPARPQVHVCLIFLLHKQRGFGHKYTPRFIFLVGKQVPATGQAQDTCPASYFGWLGKQVPVTGQVSVPHIFVR